MKIELGKLLVSRIAMESIAKIKMSPTVAYKIQRNFRLIEPELQTYEEARVNMIRETYGVKNDDDQYVVPEESLSEFIEELSKLQAVKIDLDISQISVNDMNFDISPTELSAIEWMISDKTEED